MYVKQVAEYSIANMILFSHLHLHGFINSNVINFVSLIDFHNDKVIPRILWVSSYGLNILFKLTQYFEN